MTFDKMTLFVWVFLTLLSLLLLGGAILLLIMFLGFLLA